MMLGEEGAQLCRHESGLVAAVRGGVADPPQRHASGTGSRSTPVTADDSASSLGPGVQTGVPIGKTRPHQGPLVPGKGIEP